MKNIFTVFTTAMMLMITSVYAADKAPTDKCSTLIPEVQREQNQKKRNEESSKDLQESIALFYGAVVKVGEDKIARDLINIEKLTAELGVAMGTLGNSMSKMEESGGQFGTVDKSVDGQINTKNKQLDEAVANARVKMAQAKAEMDKYKNCAGMSRNECSREWQKAKNEYQSAERLLRKAEDDRRAYGQPEQISDMTKKEGAVNDSKSQVKDAENPRKAALAAGERLYQAQQALNHFVNNNAKEAVKIARDAKLKALELLKHKQNDTFKLSDQAKMEGLTADEKTLLQRVANEEASQKYLDLFAMVGAGAQHFMCESRSDVECISYHLMVAASAIYMAAQIRETADYNSNAADINCTDVDPEGKYDEQYENVVKAEKMRHEVVRTAEARMELQEILADMLSNVDRIAKLELRMKKIRVAAAEQQVAKAKQNLKKVERSIAIMGGLKIVEMTVFKQSFAVAAMNWACCGPHSAGCCARAKHFQALGEKWKAKYVVTVATLGYYANELIKAQKELKRAKQELADAKVHTHMKCWKDMSNDAINKHTINRMPGSRIGRIALLSLSLMTSESYAQDSIALGAKENTGIYTYYAVHKEKDAEAQSKAYPTPETRVTYMINVAMEISGQSVGASGDYLNTLETQALEYSKITNNFNDSARLNETGQVSGLTDRKVIKSPDLGKFNRTQSSIGNLDFGSLSQFKIDMQGFSKNLKGNVGSIKSSGASVKGGVGAGNAALNIQKARRNRDASLASLGRLKTKLDVKKDDSYKSHQQSVIDALASKDKSGSTSKLASSAASGIKNFKSSNYGKVDEAELNGDVDGQTGKIDDGNSLDSAVAVVEQTKVGSSVGAKAGDDSPNMKFTFDDIDGGMGKDPQVADKNCESSVGCMTDEEIQRAQEAIAGLDDMINSEKWNSDNRSTEHGVYDGNDTLFTKISNCYIKNALPVLFVPKK